MNYRGKKETMDTEKIVVGLLIISILFSVASIVFNLSISDLKLVNTNSGNAVRQHSSPGVQIYIEGSNNPNNTNPTNGSTKK